MNFTVIRSEFRNIGSLKAWTKLLKPTNEFVSGAAKPKKGVIYEFELTGKLHPLNACIDPDYLVDSKRSPQHRRR